MKKIKSGKVRDIYRFDDHHLLLLATDRLSAYDVVFSDLFPGKGVILTALTKWWLREVSSLMPVHWDFQDRAGKISPANLKEVPEIYRRDFADRSMVVKRCQVLPFECIVRGHAYGSYLKEHPEVAPMTAFEEPLFTPTTKEEKGHDQQISFEEMKKQIGALALDLREKSLALYQKGRETCQKAGLVLVDTKFEFGLDEGGEVMLIDEIFTPDSSRFFLKDDVDLGEYSSYDKQVIRNYVDETGWDHNPPAPEVPPDIIRETLKRYQTILERIQRTSENRGDH